MAACTLGFPFALLLSLLLLVTVSTTQECVPQALPDMVIDIGQAVARARFTDPLSVNSVEECLSACCMPLNLGGDADCNLLVFDARKGPGLQNCYIFHCSTLDSCPLVSSPGVFSYSLWSEPSRPEKHNPDQEPQKSRARSKAQSFPSKMSGSMESGQIDPNLRKNSAAIASQGSARHGVKEKPADSPTSITTQLLHLADQIDRHLERIESNSEDDVQIRHPSPTAVIVPAIQTATVHGEVQKIPSDAKAAKPGGATYKNPQHFYFSTAAATLEGTVPARTNLPLRTAAPQLVPRTKAGLIVPPAAPQRTAQLRCQQCQAACG
ncbi:MANEC domain [Pristimantis euphronides]